MWREQFQAFFVQLFADATAWAPRLVAMVILILLGLVVAWMGERVLRVALARFRFNALLERTDADHLLKRMGIRSRMIDLVPRVVFYLILLLFVRTAADVLGLNAISEAFAGLIGYVPNLAAALLILVIGSVLAQFAGRAVAGAAEASGLQFANSLGTGVSGLVLFVLVMMAMSQLQIDTGMVRLVSGAILGGLALGFGLSFGLGSTDVTRAILAGFYARQQLRAGEEVEVGGARGVLVGITPTQILIQSEDAIVSVPSAVLLREGAKQHGD